MPYILEADRQSIDARMKSDGLSWAPKNAGEMNYAMTMIMDNYFVANDGPRYAHLNNLVGAMEVVKIEGLPGLRQIHRVEWDQEVDTVSGDVWEHGISWTPKTIRQFAIFVGVSFLSANNGKRFSKFEIAGCLQCCQMELYRLIGGPYEDKKLAENGPAYTINPLGGNAY